jgi:hypothetical protein
MMMYSDSLKSIAAIDFRLTAFVIRSHSVTLFRKGGTFARLAYSLLLAFVFDAF